MIDSSGSDSEMQRFESSRPSHAVGLSGRGRLLGMIRFWHAAPFEANNSALDCTLARFLPPSHGTYSYLREAADSGDARHNRPWRTIDPYLMWFAAKFPSPTARSEENPDGIGATIQNATRSVRISILFVSVRWIGHFFAISISCLRCASSNGPANSMLHRMRSILDFGSSQFAQSSAWTRSCRSRTMTCSRVHFSEPRTN